MVKKKKEVKQKEDLQEPQEIMDDTSKVNESESEETTTEDSEIVEGMVRCKSCKKDVEPYPVDHNRWRCPECNKYTRSPDMKGKDIDNLKEVKPSKDRPYEILSSRNIKFSGNELAQAEMLIQSGVASNFNDLAKKAFNILFLKEKVNKAFGIDRNTMENNEPNPERTMKQIQEQEMMKAYIEGMKKGNQTDPMATMMMLRMMENQGKGKDSESNGMMNKMLEIQMMKSVMGGQNSDTPGLQREIAELKHNIQMQQILSQQQQVQQGNTSSQEFMQKIEQIRSERDRDVKQAEINAQKEREKNLQLAFDNRRVELESRLQAMEKEMKEKSSGSLATSRIKEMKEEIAAIKEMSTVLGDREKGTGEMLLEGLAPAAEKIIPALVDLGKQRQQQQMMSQQIPPPAEQLPQELPSEQPNPESNPPGLTPTEQQMSEQMESMYLHPSEKKKQ